MSLLEVRGLTKRFGGVLAVDAVSFDVAEGEVLAMIGPNGAGKSTCFAMLDGGLAPDAGTIRLAGEDVAGLPPRRIWRRGVGRTFQVAAPFRSMTVRENVQAALISGAGRSLGLLRPATRMHRAEADALLDVVGLRAEGDRPAAALPYGELKRLDLALALSNRPRLLLLDEPTAGMTPAERAALMTTAAGWAAERGASVLYTEHDMDAVFAHADRIMVLDRGRVIADGTAEVVRADARVREVYLGEGVFGGAP